MRGYLLFSFLFSVPVFSQGTAFGEQPVPPSEKNRPASFELNQMTAELMLKQLQEETFLLDESSAVSSPVEFFPFAAFLINNSKAWEDPHTPGPLFFVCKNSYMSVICHWTVLRIDRLNAGRGEGQQVEDSWITAEKFEEEVQRLMSLPVPWPLGRVSLTLLTALEFYDWAVTIGIQEPEQLFPSADILAEKVFSRIRLYLDSVGGPFMLYALHRYFEIRGFAEKKARLQEIIKGYFYHRNDGGEEDLNARKQFCAALRRAGVHESRLKENKLILPGYEEFKARTAEEDLRRVEDCEIHYQQIIRGFTDPHKQNFNGEFFRNPAYLAVFEYYSSIVFLLYKVLGPEAVRHFVRNNPVLHKIEPVPFEKSTEWIVHYWERMRTFLILRDIEEDIEWRAEWQAVIDAHKKEFGDNLLLVAGDQLFFSFTAVFQFFHLAPLAPDSVPALPRP